MDFKAETLKFLDCLGEEATVTVGEDSYPIKALIQPMRYKNKMYLEDDRTELGFKNGECFLYLGPAEPDFAGVETSTTVTTKHRVYSFSRADRIALKGITQYIWAVLTPKYKDGAFYGL